MIEDIRNLENTTALLRELKTDISHLKTEMADVKRRLADLESRTAYPSGPTGYQTSTSTPPAQPVSYTPERTERPFDLLPKPKRPAGEHYIRAAYDRDTFPPPLPPFVPPFLDLCPPCPCGRGNDGRGTVAPP